MLDSLFASESIKRILLFVFVNRKCYGALLQKTFNCALTPIQNALYKLEKGGVFTSYTEGKTKIYIFNRECVLLEEIEALLKKAYLHLSSEEKRLLSSKDKSSGILTDKKAYKQLNEMWDTLSTVSQLKMLIKSGSSYQAGVGVAEVHVEKIGSNILVFKEKGEWQQGLSQTEFVNVFRWTLDPSGCLINLEHLRHGKSHPTFLFSLFPNEKGKFTSIMPMHCRDDIYIGSLSSFQNQFRMNCRVIGPKKNEEISYCYS